MQKKLVSIISPCYNGEKYLKNFLQSVLDQNYENIELIMVDDGSTDESADVILSYRQPFEEKGYRLEYIYQDNRGQAAAMNQGLQVFSGEYLMWVDADDILYPDNVSKKVEFLEKNSEFGFVLCQVEVVDSKDLDKPIGKICRIKPEGEDSFFEDLIYEKNICFGPLTVLVRREAILCAIPSRRIYESREGQNWQLMLPLAHTYPCGYINEVLGKVVAHEDSHSRTERTYEQRIDRYNGFQLLLNHTIDNIVDMDESEKEEWKRKITIKYQRLIWRMLYLNGNKKRATQAKKLLYACGARLSFRFDVLYVWKKKLTQTKLWKRIKKVRDKIRGKSHA